MCVHACTRVHLYFMYTYSYISIWATLILYTVAENRARWHVKVRKKRFRDFYTRNCWLFTEPFFYDIHQQEKDPWGKKYTEKEGKSWGLERNNKEISSRDSCPSDVWTIGLNSQLRPSVSNAWKYKKIAKQYFNVTKLGLKARFKIRFVV